MRKTFLLVLCLYSFAMYGQGAWLPVAHTAPDYFNGVAILLSDGSVMVKACHGVNDTVSNLWDRLTPDTNGSYVSGTWSTIASMHYTRLYCSSQLLKDGRVYVAGGEYGTGGSNGETYDPVSDRWTKTGTLPGGYQILDGNTQLLPDGRVLQNVVLPTSADNCIFNPATNSYTIAPACLGGADEAAWLKLPDNSILFVNINSRLSERYIPALNQWVHDDTLPVSLYDTYGEESGAAFLLPDGRAFFIGSTSTSAYYTPSGNNTPGTWAAGPPIPDSLGAPDAAAAMMPNGKILCAFSKAPTATLEYAFPTWFYEFDYLSNTFTPVSSPQGGDNMHVASYMTGMLDLPDGNILFTTLDSNRYYIYMPGGTPVASGAPVVDNIININCDTFMATGKIFNGISQGAAYGDDWQMPTNYPVIRLTIPNNLYGDLVYYARSFNWNSTGVMRGNLEDTTYFTLPAGLPYNTYSLQVVANGIASAPYSFTQCINTGITQTKPATDIFINVFPNPASLSLTITATNNINNIIITNLVGQAVYSYEYNTEKVEVDVSGLPAGIYFVKVNGTMIRKFVKE